MRKSKVDVFEICLSFCFILHISLHLAYPKIHKFHNINHREGLHNFHSSSKMCNSRSWLPSTQPKLQSFRHLQPFLQSMSRAIDSTRLDLTWIVWFEHFSAFWWLPNTTLGHAFKFVQIHFNYRQFSIILLKLYSIKPKHN